MSTLGLREGDANAPIESKDQASPWVEEACQGLENITVLVQGGKPLRPIIHCCYSVIKEARTADKTDGLDFKRQALSRVPKSSELHLLHLVCVSDKDNFRVISTHCIIERIH